VKKIALAVAAISALVVIEIAASADPTPTAQAPVAQVLYTEGQAAFDRADYITAIAKWRASYDLSGASGLLFDIAQAMRLSDDCPGAIAAYTRFIAIDEASDQRQIAIDFKRELESKCGIRPIPAPVGMKPIPAPAPTAEPNPPRALNLANVLSRPKHEKAHTSRKLRVAGLAASGAGVAAIATGIGLGLHAQAIGNEITSTCASGCAWTALRNKDANGHRDAAIGYALDGLGAAAIVGGAIAYYLGIRGGAIEPRGDGAVVSWRKTW
jgi:hypothetical protein